MPTPYEIAKMANARRSAGMDMSPYGVAKRANRERKVREGNPDLNQSGLDDFEYTQNQSPAPEPDYTAQGFAGVAKGVGARIPVVKAFVPPAPVDLDPSGENWKSQMAGGLVGSIAGAVAGARMGGLPGMVGAVMADQTSDQLYQERVKRAMETGDDNAPMDLRGDLARGTGFAKSGEDDTALARAMRFGAIPLAGASALFGGKLGAAGASFAKQLGFDLASGAVETGVQTIGQGGGVEDIPQNLVTSGLAATLGNVGAKGLERIAPRPIMPPPLPDGMRVQPEVDPNAPVALGEGRREVDATLKPGARFQPQQSPEAVAPTTPQFGPLAENPQFLTADRIIPPGGGPPGDVRPTPPTYGIPDLQSAVADAIAARESGQPYPPPQQGWSVEPPRPLVDEKQAALRRAGERLGDNLYDRVQAGRKRTPEDFIVPREGLGIERDPTGARRYEMGQPAERVQTLPPRRLPGGGSIPNIPDLDYTPQILPSGAIEADYFDPVLGVTKPRDAIARERSSRAAMQGDPVMQGDPYPGFPDQGSTVGSPLMYGEWSYEGLPNIFGGEDVPMPVPESARRPVVSERLRLPAPGQTSIEQGVRGLPPPESMRRAEAADRLRQRAVLPATESEFGNPIVPESERQARARQTMRDYESGASTGSGREFEMPPPDMDTFPARRGLPRPGDTEFDRALAESARPKGFLPSPEDAAIRAAVEGDRPSPPPSPRPGESPVDFAIRTAYEGALPPEDEWNQPPRPRPQPRRPPPRGKRPPSGGEEGGAPPATPVPPPTNPPVAPAGGAVPATVPPDAIIRAYDEIRSEVEKAGRPNAMTSAKGLHARVLKVTGRTAADYPTSAFASDLLAMRGRDMGGRTLSTAPARDAGEMIEGTYADGRKDRIGTVDIPAPARAPVAPDATVRDAPAPRPKAVPRGTNDPEMWRKPFSDVWKEERRMASDELRKEPMLDATNAKWKKSILDAIDRGETIPPEVVAEIYDPALRARIVKPVDAPKTPSAPNEETLRAEAKAENIAYREAVRERIAAEKAAPKPKPAPAKAAKPPKSPINKSGLSASTGAPNPAAVGAAIKGLGQLAGTALRNTADISTGEKQVRGLSVGQRIVKALVLPTTERLRRFGEFGGEVADMFKDSYGARVKLTEALAPYRESVRKMIEGGKSGNAAARDLSRLGDLMKSQSPDIFYSNGQAILDHGARSSSPATMDLAERIRKMTRATGEWAEKMGVKVGEDGRPFKPRDSVWVRNFTPAYRDLLSNPESPNYKHFVQEWAKDIGVEPNVANDMLRSEYQRLIGGDDVGPTSALRQTNFEFRRVFEKFPAAYRKRDGTIETLIETNPRRYVDQVFERSINRLSFLSVFGQTNTAGKPLGTGGDTLKNIMDAAERELPPDQLDAFRGEFRDSIAAANNVNLEEATGTLDPTSKLADLTHSRNKAGEVLVGAQRLYKTAKLSAAALRNIPQLIHLGPQVGGWRNFARAWASVLTNPRQSFEAARNAGVIINAMKDFDLAGLATGGRIGSAPVVTEGHKFRDMSGAVSEAIYRGSGFKFTSDLNQAVGFQIGKGVADQIRKGQFKDRAALRLLDFTEAQVEALVGKRPPSDLVGEIPGRTARNLNFMLQGQERQSAAQNSAFFRMVFPFMSFMQNTYYRQAQVIRNNAIELESGDPKRQLRATKNILSSLVGAPLSNELGMVLIALAAGNLLNDQEEEVRNIVGKLEKGDVKGAALGTAKEWMDASFEYYFSPIARIGENFDMSSPIESIATSSSLPLSLLAEVGDIAMGGGRYRDRNAAERAWEFTKSTVPAIGKGASLMAAVAGQRDHKLDASIGRFYDFMRRNGQMKGEADPGNNQFRRRMRRAANMLEVENISGAVKEVREAIMQDAKDLRGEAQTARAGGAPMSRDKLRDPSQSLAAKKTVTKLSPEWAAKFLAEYGMDDYERLAKNDAMLDAFAQGVRVR